jgi:hypothetical protein
MFKWIMTDFFFEKAGSTPAGKPQQAHSKQTSIDKFLLQTSEEDTSRLRD